MEIQKVLDFAIEKHKGQVDKFNKPYIFHPISIALKMESNEEKIVALLHDILEDTNATIKDLKDLGLTDALIESIKLLTRAENVTYMEYIKELSKDTIARKVKLADLEHNMDVSRGVSKEVLELQETRYKKAYKFLMEVEK